MFKKILKITGVTVLAVVVLFLVVIGPWPVYKDSRFQSAGYYKRALATLEDNMRTQQITADPGRLQAGWAVRIITPKIGTPLGGYGDRRGAPSTGVRDDLYAKALVLSDGRDSAAIVGTDMLLVPPNVADIVRKKVSEETRLTANEIYFTASHTHCGPGAWAPGLAGYVTGGKYDPSLVEFLGNAIADAVIEAHRLLKPAKLAHGAVDAPDRIRNRTRKTPVDSELSFLLLEQDAGSRCYVVRFSAHPTIFSGKMMEFSAEYPGALQRNLESATGATAMYVGGGLGSCSPAAPDGPDASARVEAMGEALAKLVLENSATLEFQSHVDIAAAGMEVGMAQMQMRPVSPKWRLSPLTGKIFGVPPVGWVHAVRVGDLMFVGMPFDFSGETSKEWKEWAARRDITLWPTSFCAAYCGYLSPDRYYWEAPLGYETGMMSWFGPNMEAQFTALMQRATELMYPPQAQALLAQ